MPIIAPITGIIDNKNNKFLLKQGSLSSTYNVILQTSYNKEHDVSMLYVTDFSSGKLLKSLKLIDINDKDNMKHVGGISTDNNRFITSYFVKINHV